jgi:rhodanese-related sulfurtransferase
VQEITPKELKARLNRGDRLVLLDVRQDWEARICRMDGSLNIPLDQLGARMAELVAGREIVVYCHHGLRSLAAAVALSKKGFQKVLNLTGGIAAWAHEVDPAMNQY